MNTQILHSEIEVQDLSDVAVELNDDELQAVAGARMSVSWTCGSRRAADEWVVN